MISSFCLILIARLRGPFLRDLLHSRLVPRNLRFDMVVIFSRDSKQSIDLTKHMAWSSITNQKSPVRPLLRLPRSLTYNSGNIPLHAFLALPWLLHQPRAILKTRGWCLQVLSLEYLERMNTSSSDSLPDHYLYALGEQMYSIRRCRSYKKWTITF